MLKSLGIGLNAEEKYRRAFEKGVLLCNWGEAARLFLDAAKAFEKEGNGQRQRQALANAHLYEFLASRQMAVVPRLIDLLRSLQRIECIGSATETMPAEQLAAELQALMAEMQVAAVKDSPDPATKAAAHERARDSFAAITSGTLVVYPCISEGRFTETAESRFHAHAAWVSYYQALAKLASDPAAAAEELGRAVVSFRLGGYGENEQEMARLLADMRLSRTCWLCGREMQAQGFYFEYLPTAVRPYHRTVLEKAHQDLDTVQLEGSRVVVCTVCKGLILGQARVLAEQVIAERVAPLEAQVHELGEAVQRLARMAHHH